MAADRPSLADALAAPARSRRARCGVAIVFDHLGPEDADTLTDALASDMTSSGIARALRTLGHTVPAYTVNRHRKGECACEPR